MPLTPQVTVTCNLQEITGSPGASKITYELVAFNETVPRVSGTAVIVQTSFTVTADGSGNTSITLWGLDQITPAGCFYTATFYNESGGVVATLAYDAFVGSGSFDLSQVVPMGQQVVAAAQPNSAIPQIFTPIAHNFLTGMNSLGVLSSAQPSFSDLTGTATASQLPLPTASTLGGVKSLAAVSHKFITSIGTDGIPVAAQPSFSDLTGSITIPNPSPTTLGGIESFVAVTHQWINAISTLGVPSSTQPAFTDISGTASTGQIPNLAASIITSGLFGLARGGTNADLSATGGAHQVLKQISVGAAITVGQLSTADLSDGVTGSGAIVLAGTPTLTTPILGVATATTINKVTITAPATSATLTILNGKTFSANNTLTLAGVDGKTLTINNTLTFAGTDATTITFQGTDTYMGRATTDTATNKTFTGVTTGNNLSVLNAQGATTALTGNGTDQVVYTYTLPANTIDTNSKAIRVTTSMVHSSGTANPLLKINLNGVNVVNGSIGTVASQSASLSAAILRTSSTTGGSSGSSIGVTAGLGVLVPFSLALTGLNWAANQTLTITFNVAATDQVTGIMFLVEQVQ